MHNPTSRFVLLFTLLAGPSAAQTESAPQAAVEPPAVSPEVRKLLDAWTANLRDLKTLRVRFTQTKRLKIRRRPRISSGEARLLGKTLYMRTTNARGQVETELHVDDGKVRIHYPTLRKLEVYPADQSTKTKPPFPLVTDDIESLPRDHELSVESVAGNPDAELLVMTPRDAKSQITRATIRFEKGQMVAVTQRNRRGDEVELAIDEFAVNAEVRSADVELEVPNGTTVVEMGARAAADEAKPRSRPSK